MNRSNKMSNAERIRNYIAKHPDATAKKISDTLSVPPTSVYAVKHKAKVKPKAVYMADVPEVVDTVTNLAPERVKELVYEISQGLGRDRARAPDMVNHPPHYKMGGIETIDFIEAKALDFNLGNVVKYVTRADHKGSKVEDLQKAQFYLRRALAPLLVRHLART